jgi:hypothetical protein
VLAFLAAGAAFSALIGHAAATDDALESGSAAPVLQTATLQLRVPKEEIVAFSGVVNYDAAGNRPGYMLYPAPDPLTAVAGLVTHGVVEGMRKRHEKTQIRDAANEVLAPYEAVLSRFTNADLMRRGLDALEVKGSKVLISFADHAGPGIVVECRPNFFMTQDGRALVLENAIIIRRLEAGPATALINTIKVIGAPLPEVDSNVQSYWLADDGDSLQTASVNLLRDSLMLALEDLYGILSMQDMPFRTIRYPEGGVEKMERARVIRATDARLVLKNLRGWIVSVPAAAAAPGSTPARNP